MKRLNYPRAITLQSGIRIYPEWTLTPQGDYEISSPELRKLLEQMSDESSETSQELPGKVKK